MDLFFNLVHRVYFYYDNSDGVLSDELIARKAYDVMNYTEFDAMEFKSLDTGKVTTSPDTVVNTVCQDDHIPEEGSYVSELRIHTGVV